MTTTQKTHPYKVIMWLAIGSMIMFFAGLTSAYIVRSYQAHWKVFALPSIFYLSTFLILASSLTLHLAQRRFHQRQHSSYHNLMYLTIILGIAFMISQWQGFMQLSRNGILLNGNVAGSFIYLIAGLHLLHVLGGLVGLLILTIKHQRKGVIVVSSVGLSVIQIYWHFVDILWLYLITFFVIFR